MRHLRISLAFAAATALTFGVPAAASDSGSTRGVQIVQLSVTKEGFVPSQVTVKAGQPVKLVVTRKTDRTCATEIVMKDFGVKEELPLEKPVTVNITPRKPGQFRYACGMDMIAGALKVE